MCDIDDSIRFVDVEIVVCHVHTAPSHIFIQINLLLCSALCVYGRSESHMSE